MKKINKNKKRKIMCGIWIATLVLTMVGLCLPPLYAEIEIEKVRLGEKRDLRIQELDNQVDRKNIEIQARPSLTSSLSGEPATDTRESLISQTRPGEENLEPAQDQPAPAGIPPELYKAHAKRRSGLNARSNVMTANSKENQV